MRNCIRCKIDKSLIRFSGRHAYCMDCANLHRHVYYKSVERKRLGWKERTFLSHMKAAIIEDRKRSAGKCTLCGYGNNLAALDFHHKEQKDKLFIISQTKNTCISLDDLFVELNKCILLCKNCHQEVHYPHLKIV